MTFLYPESIEIKINIIAILLNVDVSIENIVLDNGYIIKKISIEEFPYKDQITDARGKLNQEYYGSRIIEESLEGDKVFFMCISKEDILTLNTPPLQNGVTFSEKPFCDQQLDVYKDNQFDIINDFISKMLIFKNGDIGLHKIFFNFNFEFIGKYNIQKNIWIPDAKTFSLNKYILSDNEAFNLSHFIIENVKNFDLFRAIIDSFTYSYKFIEPAKSFEQLTTVLEMMFLMNNQPAKKETLAKRLSLFIGNDDIEIKTIYEKMKQFYKYRSESLHEGENTNITLLTVDELNEFTRLAIKKYLHVIDKELGQCNSVSLPDIKYKLITNLINSVSLKIESGVLPN